MTDGVAAAGPLAQMWRSVYRKAAAAAEARLGDLLRDHVYLFHRDMGFGAGGGPVAAEIGRAVATAGQNDLRVPASGALPTGYGALYIVATGLTNAASGVNEVFLFFNGDTTTTNYNYSHVTGTPGSGTVTSGGSGTAGSIRLGQAPALNAAQPQAVFGASGTVPLHESTTFPKVGTFLSTNLSTAAAGPQPITTVGVYAPTPPAPVTSVHLRCLFNGWRVGSTVVVYGWPAAA